MSFIMSCGCELEEKDLKRVNNRKTCIVHGGTIVKRKGYCVNDGKVFYRNIKGQLGLYCDECQQKAIDETNKKKYAKQKAENAMKKAAKQKRIEKMLAKNREIAKAARVEVDIEEVEPVKKYDSNRGDYCKCALSCTDYPACLDCDSFYPRFDGVDPLKEGIWAL